METTVPATQQRLPFRKWKAPSFLEYYDGYLVSGLCDGSVESAPPAWEALRAGNPTPSQVEALFKRGCDTRDAQLLEVLMSIARNAHLCNPDVSALAEWAFGDDGCVVLALRWASRTQHVLNDHAVAAFDRAATGAVWDDGGASAAAGAAYFQCRQRGLTGIPDHFVARTKAELSKAAVCGESLIAAGRVLRAHPELSSALRSAAEPHCMKTPAAIPLWYGGVHPDACGDAFQSLIGALVSSVALGEAANASDAWNFLLGLAVTCPSSVQDHVEALLNAPWSVWAAEPAILFATLFLRSHPLVVAKSSLLDRVIRMQEDPSDGTLSSMASTLVHLPIG